MSVVGPVDINNTYVKPVLKVCYDNNLVTSQGVFLGDDPLLFSLPILLLEMSIIFLATHAVHHVLRRLGQPRLISQLVTGIILGPSVIGHSITFQSTVFPTRGTYILDTCSLFGLILFVFDIGVKTDLSLLGKARKREVAIGLVGSIIPFALVSGFYALRIGNFNIKEHTLRSILFLAERLALSAFPVISEALGELGLLNSDVGRVVMSATLIADILGWVINAGITTGTLIVQAKTAALAVSTLASMVGFTLIIIFVVRPLMLFYVKKVPQGELLGEGFFLVMMLVVLATALATEVIGYHPIIGPFLLGLVLPGGMPIGVTLTERLEPIEGLFVPLYVVLAGFRTKLNTIHDWETWRDVELIFAISYVGKLAGAAAAAVYFDTPLRDAVTMGLMLNIKGIIEIWFFNTWGDMQETNTEHFAMMILSLLLTTSITTPLVKLLYNPSIRFVATKRRTIQHSKPNSALRLLACVHNEDHVAPLIDVLEASYPSAHSPLSLHLLHLTELAGCATSVLRPYKNRHGGNPSPSDRIVSAFRYFEQQHPCGAVALHPYIAVSPVNTMHNDVCSLALSKKAHLVILPFHKQSDGARETTKASFQSLNRKVLDFAPCSVAILVDRVGSITCTHTNRLLQHAVIYFLGGADDREALSIAMRMVEGEIALTVVRLRSRDNRVEANEEDEAVLEECRVKYGDNEAMMFIEKYVVDGEGTVAVMREMNQNFDLVIVGRRKRKVDPALTSGLSAWSDCPELGGLGDILSSMEFEGKVSILVVQQQDRIGSKEDGSRCSSKSFAGFFGNCSCH